MKQKRSAYSAEAMAAQAGTPNGNSSAAQQRGYTYPYSGSFTRRTRTVVL